MTEREGLTHPVHFVAPPGEIWPELSMDADADLSDEVLANRSRNVPDCWIQRTYVHLRAIAPVTLGDETRDGVVNVISTVGFTRRRRDPDHFVVIPRGDHQHPVLANFTIVQNTGLPDTKSSCSIPHWPQADIRPRNAARNALSVISFKGGAENISAAFRDSAFQRALDELGICFEPGSLDGGPASWSDYSEVDAVLAVRDMTVANARHKPASKLVNAWHAGVPAILGPEPAFLALRRDPLDFIEVRTPEEALSAIRRLRDDNLLYSQMVANGHRRALEFTVEKVRHLWVDAFETRIFPVFDRWKRWGRARRRLDWAYMMAADPLSHSIKRHTIRHGRRILEG